MTSLRAHQEEQAEAAFNDELRRRQRASRLVRVVFITISLIPIAIIAVALWRGRK